MLPLHQIYFYKDKNGKQPVADYLEKDTKNSCERDSPS